MRTIQILSEFSVNSQISRLPLGYLFPSSPIPPHRPLSLILHTTKTSSQTDEPTARDNQVSDNFPPILASRTTKTRNPVFSIASLQPSTHPSYNSSSTHLPCLVLCLAKNHSPIPHFFSIKRKSQPNKVTRSSPLIRNSLVLELRTSLPRR
jgi:hypothetical protein